MTNRKQKHQNLLAIQRVLSFCIEKDAPAGFSADYYELSKITAKPENWYFSGACDRCGYVRPLFKDLSSGKWHNFVGKSYVQSKCDNCKEMGATPIDKILSIKW